MDSVLVILQIVLAGVLAVAAVGKILDLDGARQAVRDFGVPDRYAKISGTMLPGCEALLAIGLLIFPLTRWAALGTFLLFGVFIIAIGWNLRLGRQPDCHCFGQIHSEPAGPSTLIRNSALALATIPLIWTGGRSIVAWLKAFSEAEILALVIAILLLALGTGQLWLMRQLVAQNERILRRIERLSGVSLELSGSSPDTDTPRVAPAFDVENIGGGRLALAGLLARGKPTLLLFVNPGCGPCRQLVPDMVEWNRRFRDEVTIAWLSMRSADENWAEFGDAGLDLVGIQRSSEVMDEYKVSGTPTGVLIDPDGIVREPYAVGADRIRELLDTAVRGKENAIPHLPLVGPTGDSDDSIALRPSIGAPIGTVGSRIPLQALDGSFVSIDDFRGHETILLFVGADCTFTRSILPDIVEWEETAGADEVSHVLVVSSGTVEENKHLNLSSRIVLDNGFAIANGYGAVGTPAAIVLDEAGKVVSPLAAGGDAVLDLLWSRIPATDDEMAVLVERLPTFTD